MSGNNAQITRRPSSVSAVDEMNWKGMDTPVYAVVSAVAEREGVDECDLPPLADAVDADALNKLIIDAEGLTSIRFRYAGYDVEVRGDGAVRLSTAESDR